MKLQRGELALGLGAVVLAAGYLRLADGIGESLLSDTVGAAGLPRAVGWALAAVGLLLCVRSVVRAAPQGEAAGAGWRPHLRALGLLAILFGYVLLAPWLGYAAATGLLLAAGAAYAGVRSARELVLVPVIAAFVFWLLFVHAFGIPMPGSLLLGGP
ncbi:tripartite tricarboxylate transporter TctB family protein [Ramlibacter alkalitolerans]|uniref:Tripartite tricarboxylate transporter TctB family protein n=1 Tax=Ramlibacter alkalitolerans TaxID=2039631 RepID=A0ABS1JJF7_9BURK|nr:tripartite tricarboxylate transporter TctB family protein [Ramlibacter alkalitolerans]MBL0424353.1 tripartite tricarboxylate transporter TctB family protein [Ramlibacter alkalitolerans]